MRANCNHQSMDLQGMEGSSSHGVDTCNDDEGSSEVQIEEGLNGQP